MDQFNKMTGNSIKKKKDRGSPKIEPVTRHKKFKSFRNRSSNGANYSGFKLDINPKDIKKKLKSLNKHAGVFNYEKSRKNAYEHGSFISTNKENNQRYSNLSHKKSNKSKYGSSGSKIKTAVKVKSKKNRSISKHRTKAKKRTKSKSKNSLGLKRLKKRIKNLYTLRNMNEAKTIKTKSFYAYKRNRDQDRSVSKTPELKIMKNYTDVSQFKKDLTDDGYFRTLKSRK